MVVRLSVLCLTLAAVGATWAFPSVPKASAKALGVTRGKPFSSGIVFINGKYLPPPYTVERWGTGLRINGRKVSGQIVDWAEFVRTQSGARIERSAAPAPEAASAPAAAPAPTAAPAPAASAEDDDSPAASLDDLFADAPAARAKTAPKKVARKPAAAPSAAPTVSYSFDGAFQPNATTKRLVTKINDQRTAIDAHLRRGGFIFFGDAYSRVTGDAATALAILEKVPDLQHRCESASDLAAAARAAGLYYLSAAVCEDLFANRIDYRALQERRAKWRQEREFDRMINGTSGY